MPSNAPRAAAAIARAGNASQRDADRGDDHPETGQRLQDGDDERADDHREDRSSRPDQNRAHDTPADDVGRVRMIAWARR